MVRSHFSRIRRFDSRFRSCCFPLVFSFLVQHNALTFIYQNPTGEPAVSAFLSWQQHKILFCIIFPGSKRGQDLMLESIEKCSIQFDARCEQYRFANEFNLLVRYPKGRQNVDRERSNDRTLYLLALIDWVPRGIKKQSILTS